MLLAARCSERPQIAPGAEEIRFRLVEQCGDDSNARLNRRRILIREREAITPQLHGAIRKRTFTRGLIAFVWEHGDVERRVVRPPLENPMIEVEPVHLGAHDVVVRLLVDWPPAGIDRRQSLLVRGQLAVLRSHRRGPIIGGTVDEPRFLERTPVVEERDEVVIARGPLCPFTGVACESKGEDQNRNKQRDTTRVGH